MRLLSKLEVIVLVGKKAQSAAKQIQTMTGARIVKTYHMSATVCNIWPEKRRQILADFRKIAESL